MQHFFTKSYHKLAGIAAILAVILFMTINLLSSALFSSSQLDVTADSLYTLSEGTEEALEELKEPIKLRFFFSNRLANGFPSVKSYATRIQGMLEQYVSESDGQISLEVIDPEPFSEEEDLADTLGLKGAPVDNSGTKLYFGLVATNSVDQTQAIPFFVMDREKFMEYDITRMITDLANAERTHVALISSVAMELPPIPGLVNMPDNAGPWAVIQQARQLFNVTTVNLDDGKPKIPEDATLIMVVNPQDLDDDMLYQIDQFVMRKGRALFFIDPDQANNPNDASEAKKSFSLFDKWGIQVNLEEVVGDRLYASPLPQREGDEAQAKLPILSNLIIDNQNSFNQDDIVSADLNIIQMTHAGHVALSEGSELVLTPLIQSSPRSTLLNVNMVRFGAPTRQLLRQFTSDNKQYNLAARIQGRFKSAFAGDKNDENYMAESNENANIIVVADIDMLRDNAWVKTQRFLGYQLMQPFADNGSFAINAIDNLAGSGNLISLRTRGTGSRNFEVVDELRKEAEERFLNKEKELQEELKRTEEALNRLQSVKGDGADLTLSTAQQMEIQRFQEQKLRVRKELRGVQRELNREIESLGSWLKFLNIALVPLLVTIIAIILLFIRNKKQSGGR